MAGNHDITTVEGSRGDGVGWLVIGQDEFRFRGVNTWGILQGPFAGIFFCDLMAGVVVWTWFAQHINKYLGQCGT